MQEAQDDHSPDVMTSDPHPLEETATIRDAARSMRDHYIGVVVLVTDGRAPSRASSPTATWPSGDWWRTTLRTPGSPAPGRPAS